MYVYKINMDRGSSYLGRSVVVLNMNFELSLFYFLNSFTYHGILITIKNIEVCL